MENKQEYYNNKVNDLADTIRDNKFNDAERLLLDLLMEFLENYPEKPEEIDAEYSVADYLFFYYNDKTVQLKDINEKLDKEYPLNSKLLVAVKNPNLINSIIFQIF